MKKTWTAILALVLAAAMLVPAACALEPDAVVSGWAREEIARAEALGLTAGLDPEQDSELPDDYTTPITREDFCKLAINYVERQNHFDPGQWMFNGMALTYIYEVVNEDDINARYNPFTDYPNMWGSDDAYTAYFLKIAVGDQNHAFHGDDPITRQEAATMLVRAYGVCGGEIPAEAGEITFNDAEEIADWAKANAAALAVWKIMVGDDRGNFDPRGQCTYEQAVVMFLRLYENAPVSRVNGNNTQLFTYEQCMEFLNTWQSDLYHVNQVLEGNGVTFVRWDIQGVMMPATLLMFVYPDGGMKRMMNTTPWALSYRNELIDPAFSEDGKTFTFGLTLGDEMMLEYDGPTYEAGTYLVTVDTETCEHTVVKAAG